MTNIHMLLPTPSCSTIEEANLSAGRLASILDGAVIDNTIDEDGHILASDGLDYPSWIAIDADRKLLCLFTSYSPDHTLSYDAERVLRLVNDINRSHVLVQFHWGNGRLNGHYWMTFDGRLDPRQFIKMLRSFSGAFASGVEALTAL